jgi:hypothetical protein
MFSSDDPHRPRGYAIPPKPTQAIQAAQHPAQWNFIGATGTET